MAAFTVTKSVAFETSQQTRGFAVCKPRATPISEGLARSLHAGSLLPGRRTIVLIGGTGKVSPSIDLQIGLPIFTIYTRSRIIMVATRNHGV